MNLGIFFDAVAVAGQGRLVQRAKAAMIEMMRGESAYLAHFARYIDQFAGASAGMLTSLMASVGVGSRPDRHQEVRHVSDRARHPHAVDRARHQCHGDGASASRRWWPTACPGRAARPRARERIVVFHGDPVALAAARGQGRHGTKWSRSCASASSRPPIATCCAMRLRVVKQFREVIRHRYHLGMF